MKFIDEAKIFVKSGDGGDGCLSFRREKYIEFGGPDGGNGGNIIIKGNSNMWTLLHLRYKKHIFAEHGEQGTGNHSFGKNGKNSFIEVKFYEKVIKSNKTYKLILYLNRNKKNEIY